MRARLDRHTNGWIPAEWFVRQGWFDKRRKALRGWAALVVPILLVVTGAFAYVVDAAATSTSNAQSYYGSFSNGLPTSPSFFPIGVYYQSPSGGDVPAPYTNQAQAFKAEGVNVFIGISPGWPTSYGVDSLGQLAAACAAGMYVIGSDLVGTAAAGAPNSASSVLAAANSEPNCAKYLVGYDLGDEPACSVNVAAQVAAVHAVDPSRMAYENTAGFYPNIPSAQCVGNLNAPDIASSDDYAVTNPWSPNCLVRGTDSDCLWEYGVATANTVKAAANKPAWIFVETGSDNMAQSSQNGSVCDATTNLCTDGNQERATAVQVNSAAWLTLINGSQGLEWFCDDSVTGPDACAGGGSDGKTSACSPTCWEAANLTYVDKNVEGFAPELNSPSVSAMSVTSSNSAVPIVEMTKVVGGTTYLFVESDRNGSTTGTFSDPGLAGDTATLVYDSAAHYDPAASEQGDTFTLSSTGSFSDSLGTASNPYQVKVYAIGGTALSTPTTAAPTPTTAAPTPTTAAPTPTTAAPTPTTAAPTPTTIDPPTTTTADPPPTIIDPPPTTIDPPTKTVVHHHHHRHSWWWW